jgi:ABC-type multidrug transport system ATPase subunit
MQSQSSHTQPPVLAQGLRLSYRRGFFKVQQVHAIQDLDLWVNQDEVLGVVGPNGSGKSSLFRSLLGLVPIAAGKVQVLGAAPGRRQSLALIGHQAEERLPLGRFTAREFLTLDGTLRGQARSEASDRAELLLGRVGLLEAADRYHQDFSTGMARRLSLAHALYAEPRLLLLDEPTAGMDPFGVEMTRQILAEETTRGCTCIVATHSLEELEGCFDRLLVLYRGRALALAPPEEILAKEGRHEFVVEDLDDYSLEALEERIDHFGGKLIQRKPSLQKLSAWLREREGGGTP